MKQLIADINEHGMDRLLKCEGVYGCDLHNRLYNEDYYVVGTYRAKQAMGGDAFDIISEVQDYEQDHFGEVTTDFSDPEQVLNMFAYIKGEEFLQNSPHLLDCWDRELGVSDLEIIEKELGEI